ncbi:enoyl-CoA hydratase-related protein [Granulosicoccus antarcticus]|uniref:Putative enoyl-CoA hydratase echA8 n=1 Tax=Granulosicoccus antarcticus IMCC3135 TaxID=1192854 RepID=A0A2Z2P3Y3_9GAMM|nr:enoyl-CoA hydratase-related protein [Granulosicoccus antarcticus]ASJ75377.1 putative enoyl-CoA hydratase echA8 [Granulosicoccus antarcticus IMCC3135]
MAYLKTETDTRGVTTITLNRPDHHNAMDRAFIDEFTATLSHLFSSNTRILIIRATGKNFCAGADINWMKASVKLSPEQNAADAMALSNMLDALNSFDRPTIARVSGAALGGGTGLVCCCDIVVADETAQFGFSEVRLGIIPATISPYAIAAIGPRVARRYFLTGERIDAVEAYRIRLIHDVCSSDNMDRRVNEKVSALLAGGAMAQGASKKLIADVTGKPIDEQLRTTLSQRLAHIRAEDEAQEGLAAFLEKRPTSWSKQ